jgi:mannosyltransferase OCH1-like enzyme
MIPKQLHAIWVGPRRKPIEWMNTWKEKHPTWKYFLWNEENIKDFETQELIEKCLAKKLYHGVADLVRYEVLYNYGGVIAPADSICLNSVDELLDIKEDIFACYQGEQRPGLISPHIGCTKNNPLMKEMIEIMKKKKSVGSPWLETGNQIFTDTIKKLNYPIKIYPSHYFIPEYNDGKKYEGNDKIYAIHKWGTTKNIYPK